MTDPQAELIDELADELGFGSDEVSDFIADTSGRTLAYPEEAHKLSTEEAGELIDEMLRMKRKHETFRGRYGR